jgi:hypothetical protein
MFHFISPKALNEQHIRKKDYFQIKNAPKKWCEGGKFS